MTGEPEVTPKMGYCPTTQNRHDFHRNPTSAFMTKAGAPRYIDKKIRIHLGITEKIPRGQAFTKTWTRMSADTALRLTHNEDHTATSEVCIKLLGELPWILDQD